ncbi:MAG: DegT/DnrJ/EryC1/StrS family aminotransferase [Ignavibacteria bacterium]|nr:DegT/DnrJ/EryC1/StrS family aminotransferase [Ignavibacteria bacterium]
MINVTKTYLPPFEEFSELIQKSWQTRWVTNQGPLAEELELKLKEYLGVKHLLLVSNGTLALQLAIKALSLTGEIITTPFSYVATATSIMWENCRPVFCDINENDFCIDAAKIENLVTENISAILSAVSFHATKLFHTIEGGAVITDDDDLAEKLFLYRAFGHKDDEYISVGINARNSELHAAVGLCNLKRVDQFILSRKELNSLYRDNLSHQEIQLPVIPKDISYNYSYFPVLFKSEDALLIVSNGLSKHGINTRRYFYPSLNTLDYLNPSQCPVSEDLAKRVLCLPMYQELSSDDVMRICRIISEVSV